MRGLLLGRERIRLRGQSGREGNLDDRWVGVMH